MENVSKGVILVVDDMPENLDLLFGYLDMDGFKVLLAQSGEEAVQQAEETQPDIILLDVMMPGIDGFETCQRLKANTATKHIPVIFMTALSGAQNKVKGFNAGGVDYITKPFQHEEVLARVQMHLTIKNLQKELQTQNQKLAEYVDILAKKNTQLDEKNRLLQAVNATKDRFFSIVSHDLKDQLGELKGFPELIKEHLDDYSQDELKQLLADINRAIEELYGLLENLVTWSRIQRGIIEYYPEPMDVKDIISRNLPMFSGYAEQKQIMLRSAINEKLMVEADSEMLDVVVSNLLSNAIKFTNPGGIVDISAGQQGDMVEIAVSDTGIGISADQIPNLFRIDVQYQRAGTAEEKGTGLGLVICKELIEQNGGNLWVESEVGKGTTFRFTIPLGVEEE